MSKQRKKLDRLFTFPTDYTFEEMDSFLKSLGYRETDATPGSSIKYFHTTTKDIISFHRPHPGNIIKRYVLKEIAAKLTK